jgi:chromosome segregation ATPase
MDDEQIISNRLLAREQQLKAVAKSFTQLAAGLERESAEDVDRSVGALQKALSQYEFATGKAHAMVHTSVAQTAEYDETCRSVDDEMQRVQADIAQLRTALVDARAQRDHKEQCAALERVISELPSRKEMSREIEELEAELGGLTAEGDELSRSLEVRRLQFGTLLHALHGLQHQLTAEQPGEPADEAEPMMTD